MPADRTSWLIALLMAFVMLMPMGIDIYLPALPDMGRDFSSSIESLQVSITLFLFVAGFGQALIGPLADRFGRRPVVLAGVLGYAAGSLLGVFAQELTLFYLARGIQGLGACAASLVAFSAVRDRFSPVQGARLYSYMNGALCVVPALAPALGGFLAIHFGWRSTFVFMALFALLLAGAIALRFDETLAPGRRAGGPIYRWHRYAPVLSSASFYYYAGLALAGMAMILIFVASAPVILVERLGHSPMVFSLWFGANAMVNIVAFVLAPRLLDRLGRVRLMRIGMWVLVASGVLNLLGWSLLPLGALVFMLPVATLTIGFSLALGATLSLMLEPFADRAGTAAALFGTLQLSGGALLATVLLATPLPAQLAMALVAIGVVAPLLYCGPGSSNPHDGDSSAR
ncbi:multidrug effflux MFS transporter [Halotalea alkalilenta]|uniref:multidrug effflux MFS transporter n=1 Tax=Halotalea alkalilenta TaxID=376489 RepID=UPI0004803912|nr:multidrug effflux MFS transporter [Halotalea alkalilenta]